jgi:hypothetical protein
MNTRGECQLDRLDMIRPSYAGSRPACPKPDRVARAIRGRGPGDSCSMMMVAHSSPTFADNRQSVRFRYLQQMVESSPIVPARRHVLAMATTSSHFWLMIAIHERSAPKPRPGRRCRFFSRRFQPNHQAGHFGQGRLAKRLAPGLAQDRRCARLLDGLASPSVVAPKAGGPPSALPRCFGVRRE